MRPKSFDESEALQSAMFQFWESGFEGSSMQDLVDRMGISRQSLYDTYGNKRELFLSALKRYREEIVHRHMALLEQGERTPTEALRAWFESTLECNDGSPLGCLVVRTATEYGIDDAELGAFLAECVGEMHAALIRLVQRGQASGEFDPSRSAEDLASTVVTLGLGLHVIRRLPAGARRLHPSVDSMLASLAGRRH